MTYDEAMKSCIFRYKAGSHAYGTSTPESDEDYRGVFIAPLSKAFELFQTSFVGQGTLGQTLKGARDSILEGNLNAAAEQVRQAMDTCRGDLNLSVGTVSRAGEKVDEELQELRKFLKLAADSNPNIIEYLYVKDGVTDSTPAWKKIREHRGLFLSKKARWTFSGYAISQLKRIRTHRGYLLSPPARKPTRADFGIERPLIGKEHLGAAISLPLEVLAPGMRDHILAEQKYQAAKDDWDAYQRWERERNPKRRDLEKQFGYDTKHALHLVRLIRMAKEILSEGVVRVHRPDAEELLGIRNGAWPYDRLEEFADNVDADLDDLYGKSTLRDKPDYKGISRLYVETCEDHYGRRLSFRHFRLFGEE